MKTNSDYFVGSPIVAICSTLADKKFNEYICFEIDNSRRYALEKRAKIASERFQTCCPKVFEVDCNKELTHILDEFCCEGRTCYLAFIDPQGISDLKWDTLNDLLNHGKGDFLLNFPTSGLIRNLNQPKSVCTHSVFWGREMEKSRF